MQSGGTNDFEFAMYGASSSLETMTGHRRPCGYGIQSPFIVEGGCRDR
jgi:hypothetical protein